MANDETTIARLAGGVAHDFNNLLTSIKALSALALDELPPDHPTRPDLEEIERASARAVELTKQLLALSGRNVVRPATLDLNDVVRQLEPALRALVAGRATIEFRYAPGASPVSADARHLEQIVTNLVAHARDAAGPGGTVTVELERRHDQATLVVRDSGPSMSAEDAANAFEPFWNTQDGRKLGLGLAAAAALARLLDGSLAVRPAERDGTAFELRLALAGAGPGSRPPARAAGSTATAGRTILVVDDDASIRKLVQRILEGAGYRVLVGDSAERALALAEEAQGAIDLLLTDVVMPGTSGQDLQSALRQRWPRVRVLYMSGYTDDPAVHGQAGDRAGAYLSKPFGPDALLATVRQALDRET